MVGGSCGWSVKWHGRSEGTLYRKQGHTEPIHVLPDRTVLTASNSHKTPNRDQASAAAAPAAARPAPQPSLALSPYARPEVSRLLGQAGHGAGCGSEGLETTESRVQVGRRGRSGGSVSRRGGGHGSCAAATAAATERAPGFE